MASRCYGSAAYESTDYKSRTGETPEMWEAPREELGMAPEHYVCTCGPDSVPGHPLMQ